MVNLLIAAVFLLMCQHEVCTDLRFDYFKRIMVEESVNISWSVDNVSSKLKCTSLCLAKSECVTFGFVKAKGSCQAFSQVRKAKGKRGFIAYYSKRRSGSMHRVCDSDNHCYGKGVMCFKGRCICDPEFIYNTLEQACVRKPGGMHQPCVDANQCHINGSLCFNGKCMCTPGLSYHKAAQACVRKCSIYGKTMSTYKGLAIILHNDEEKEGYTLEMCINRCTSTSAFTCLSADINPRDAQCHLSSYGYLDVNEKDRETGGDVWLLATRDCAFD